jgi:PelA/Pel-15E family pectate lyase
MVLLLAAVFCSDATGAAEPTAGKRFRYKLPDAPAPIGRHTLLYASFDESQNPLDATRCYGDATAGGAGFVRAADGRFGGAIRSADPAANLFYRADHNVRADAGTISMWVATAVGKPPGDRHDRWLFGWRGPRIAGAFIRGTDGALVFGFGKRVIAADTSYALPLDPLDAGWHHVTVSWDCSRRLLWLGCDGRGISCPFDEGQFRQPNALFVGSAPDGIGAAAPVDIAIDDLVVYDTPLDRLAEPQWPAGVDAAIVWHAEAGARRFLAAIAPRQLGGGWALMYTWPTLLPCGAQGRDTIANKTFISNDKGWSTAAVATQFLYAWEILGDPAFLDVASATGDFYVAAWNREAGWEHSYEATPAGPRGIGGPMVKLQDSNQAHPIYFLTYLHRVTQDERYRATAIAGGEFVLAAQNPNGSWSYGYDRQKRTGVTAFGVPHGGEINDRCMNDAMDVMLLMYHLTQDERYLGALVRGGEWLLRVQSTGPTAGWAEQYGPDDMPIWARPFEPPAIAPGRSYDAAVAVRLMWQLTGDDRYRQSLLRFAAWLEKTATAEGWWEYYDPETGRPLVARDRRVYYADDEQQLAEYIRQMPAGEPPPKPEKRANPARVHAWATAAPTLRADDREPPLAKAVAAACSQQGDAIKELLDQQDRSGFWIHAANPVGGYGPTIHARDENAVALLRFVEQARMAIGELPLEYRGNCEPMKAAFPSATWLDTPLRKSTARPR